MAIRLWLVFAVLCGIALCWPSWQDKPLGEKPAQPVAQVRAGEEPTPVAGMNPLIKPGDYDPDTEHYWMQPWYILIGFSVAICIFGSIWWLRREGWI